MNSPEERFGLKVVAHVPVAATAAHDERDWVATGDDWRIWRSGDVLMLQYQSGEHGGGLRSIAIGAEDLAGLQDGTLDTDEVLRRHNAS